MRNAEFRGNFFQSHARDLVLATSVFAGLATGKMVVDAFEDARVLNSQMHISNAEQGQAINEFNDVYWKELFPFVILTLGSVGAAVYTAGEIFNANKNNSSSSAS